MEAVSRLVAPCKALNLDTKIVRRYVKATTADDLITRVARRSRELDTHLDSLTRRWQEGCTNAAFLSQELRAHGYRGGDRSVRRLLQSWRTSATPVLVENPVRSLGLLVCRI